MLLLNLILLRRKYISSSMVSLRIQHRSHSNVYHLGQYCMSYAQVDFMSNSRCRCIGNDFVLLYRGMLDL